MKAQLKTQKKVEKEEERKEGRGEDADAVFSFLSRDLLRVEGAQFSRIATSTHLRPESARLPRQIPSPLFRPR